MGISVVCQNKKAYHDYYIEETIEAGIMLTGPEVKSLRLGRANLRDCYARIRGEEIWLVRAHISPYARADAFNQPDPVRTRKLLLHKKEITRLIGKIKEKGFTLVATKIYFKGGKAKVELGLAKGKTTYDKRDSLKKKEAVREMAKEFKKRGR